MLGIMGRKPVHSTTERVSILLEARAAFESLAADQPGLDALVLTYSNPETGGHAENILGFYALMLRPKQTLKLPVRSLAMVCHVIEGGATVQIEDQRFALNEADTCCTPGYSAVTLVNTSNEAPAFFFIADETSLH